MVLLALLVGKPCVLLPWEDAPIQIRHMLAFADKGKTSFLPCTRDEHALRCCVLLPMDSPRG